MKNALLALAAVSIAVGATPAFAQDYRPYPTASNRWPAGLEQHERSVTRQLNFEQATQPTQHDYPPQYSYVPPPQYSYRSPPAYAYPYDYPPRPWTPR
jgi:hypothetical protein